MSGGIDHVSISPLQVQSVFLSWRIPSPSSSHSQGTARAQPGHSSIFCHIHTVMGEPSGVYSIWPFLTAPHQTQGIFRLGSQSSGRFMLALFVPCHHLVVTPARRGTPGLPGAPGLLGQLHLWGDAAGSTRLMKHKTRQVNRIGLLPRVILPCSSLRSDFRSAACA